MQSAVPNEHFICSQVSNILYAAINRTSETKCSNEEMTNYVMVEVGTSFVIGYLSFFLIVFHKFPMCCGISALRFFLIVSLPLIRPILLYVLCSSSVQLNAAAFMALKVLGKCVCVSPVLITSYMGIRG